jgi:hypothetical protein
MTSLGLCLAAVGAWAQPAATPPAPKLAVAPAEATPILAKKFESVAAPVSNAPPPAPSWQGVWTAESKQGRQTSQFVLRIVGASEAQRTAQVENATSHRSWRSTSVTGTGSHISIAFAKNGRVVGGEMDGDFEPGTGRMSVHWKRGKQTYPVLFTRTDTLVKSSAGSALPLGSPLEEMAHAIDLQMVDRLGSSHLFSVVDEGDLLDAAPAAGPRTAQPYNLKNPEVAQRFQQADVRYLLLTTLEDFENQTVDLAQGSIAYKKEEDHLDYQTRNSRQAGAQRNRNQAQAYRSTDRAGSITNSASSTRGVFDPHVKKEQKVRATIRCRLLEVATGNVLQSANHSFATNRTYVAAANGNNMVATGDLVEAVARTLAQRATLPVIEAVFPIQVLEKNEKEITINRGSEAGIQVGQLYQAFILGKEIKEPGTGAVLGRDEVIVGKIAISELHPKFCKARILDDNGIVTGSTLRRFGSK